MNDDLVKFLRDLAASYDMSRGNIMKKHVEPINRAADIIEAATNYVNHYYRHDQGPAWQKDCDRLRFILSRAIHFPPKA